MVIEYKLPCFSCALFTHMTGSGPVVGWEGALVGVDNVKVKCFPGPNTPERRSVTSRAEFEVMPAVALGKHFTTASAVPQLPEPSLSSRKTCRTV